MPIAVGDDDAVRFDLRHAGGDRTADIRQASGLRQIYPGTAADAVEMIVAETWDECAALHVHLISVRTGEHPYFIALDDSDKPAVPDGTACATVDCGSSVTMCAL
jgi:hypothetical protein